MYLLLSHFSTLSKLSLYRMSVAATIHFFPAILNFFILPKLSCFLSVLSHWWPMVLVITSLFVSPMHFTFFMLVGVSSISSTFLLKVCQKLYCLLDLLYSHYYQLLHLTQTAIFGVPFCFGFIKSYEIFLLFLVVIFKSVL